MAKVGMMEAARLAGVAKSTLQRHLSEGRLSAETVERGGRRVRQIDTAELERAYGPLGRPTEPAGRPARRPAHDRPTAIQADSERLEAEIGQLRAEVERLRVELGEERRERRQWADRFTELSNRYVRLIEGPTDSTPATRPTPPTVAPVLAPAVEWIGAELRGFRDLWRRR